MTQRPAIVKIALALLCLLLFGSLASCLTQNPVLGAIALLCLAAVLVAMGRGNCWAALGLAAYLGADAAGLWFLPYARTAGTGEAAITSGGLAILAAVFVFAGFALRKAQPDKTWTAWPWFLPVPAIGAFLLVFQVFVIPTGSMEPTLLTGDFIAVRKSGSAGITRGSIAVYRRGNSTTIKRVIGLPGDRIRIEHKSFSSMALPLWSRS